MPTFNFPDAPTIGQTFPSPPVVGAMQWSWDGEKWTPLGVVAIGGQVIYADGSVAMSGQLKLVSPPVANEDAAAKGYVDGAAAASMKTAGGQTITGGFAITSYNAGTFTAGQNFTPNPFNGNYQYLTNNGAFTLTTPTPDCAIDIMVINGATAGAIAFSGFAVAAGNFGDPLTTTNGHRFIISIRRIISYSTYLIKALQ